VRRAVVVVQRHEQRFVADEKGGLTVTRPLGDLGQGEAQLSQPLDG